MNNLWWPLNGQLKMSYFPVGIGMRNKESPERMNDIFSLLLVWKCLHRGKEVPTNVSQLNGS